MLGACAGGLSQEKNELRMFLGDVPQAIKPEAAPGFTTYMITEEEGQNWVRSVILSKQQF